MKPTLHGIAIAVILLIHGGMIGWMAWRNSPNANEIGHLPAGIYIWEFGNFDVYSVNPPLVRLVASAPVMLCTPKTDWSRYYDNAGNRCEWLLADDFIRVNGGEDSCRYFFLARIVLIPVSLLGACVCFAWARELYGLASGYLALTLWCFSPNILAWAACINPDLAATAFGIATFYAYWRWQTKPSWGRALTVGGLLGIALLTKLTWILVFAILPLLWLAWATGDRRLRTCTAWRRCGCQLGVILCLGLFLLNLGYAFSGSFQRLGEYEFVSRSLSGTDFRTSHHEERNCFRGTLLEHIPVPFPKDYVIGIDVQKRDFEQGKDSYLLGKWSDRGRWYYYLVAACVKIPLGTWGLLVLSAITSLRGRPQSSSNHDDVCSWLNSFTLLFPALFLFIFISAQTGLSRHFRYVLPVLPFLFVWISRIAPGLKQPRSIVRYVSLPLLVWFLASSLFVFPHSMSYFNEIAGGPNRGHGVLLDSNLDWGQDLLYLKEWASKHPEARPLHTDCYGHWVLPEVMGIGPTANAELNVNVNLNGTERPPSLQPGWHAISVHRMHKTYPYLTGKEPFARINYSILVFRIDDEIGLSE